MQTIITRQYPHHTPQSVRQQRKGNYEEASGALQGRGSGAAQMLTCCSTSVFIPWEVCNSHLSRCLGLAVRDSERFSRQGGLGGRGAAGLSSSTACHIPPSIRSPRRRVVEHIQTAAVPLSNLVGKSWSRAMKSGPTLNVTYVAYEEHRGLVSTCLSNDGKQLMTDVL